MCWKRMSDNWKAYILAYAWPAPVSSRILWSLLLLSHSNLNREFFPPSCQLESCEILSILVFVLLGNGQVLERNEEQVLADAPYSSGVQPSHPNLMTAWPERRLGDSCCREKGGVSSSPNSGCPFTLTPDPCSVVESLPGAMPLGTDQRGQISRLPSAVGVVCIRQLCPVVLSSMNSCYKADC